jgi:hypothetical protein
MNTIDPTTLTGERADLLAMLAKARGFLRFTARDLDEDQARRRTTVSELTIGGLIKHVASIERTWQTFIVAGPKAGPDYSNLTEAYYAEWANGFRLLDGETLAAALAARRALVAPPHAAAHRRGNRPARGPRRHYQGSPRRPEDHGLDGAEDLLIYIQWIYVYN